MKTKKRLLSIMLTLAMVLGMMPGMSLTAFAGGPPAYSGGTGTQTNPYLISTVDDWKALAAAVNSGTDYSGKYFKQTADLDMSNASDIKPVGKMETPFAGSYDGDGFKISNAAIQGITDVVYDGQISLTVAGVFGSVAGGGSISNLVADNLTVNATDAATGFPFTYAGGLIAYAEGCAVENCSVSNSRITATGNQTNFAGGIIAFASADGNNNKAVALSKCASEKNAVSAGIYAGGVVGAIQNDNNGTLSFTDCYSAKNTVNGEWISAFLGASQGGNATLTNGFVYDCSAGSKGVFISDTTYGKLNAVNCYYYDTHDLNANAEGATAKTADEMKSLASVLGDTFTDGELYPVFGHKHSFTYSANGATITATCDNADGKCSLTDSKVTLTIGDPTNIYWDDKSSSHEFTLVGLEAFNSATGKTISASDIVYYKGDNPSQDIKNNNVKGAAYKARLTVEGVKAEHSFTFTAKPIVHTHKFTYTADGNVITATCTQNASNMEACDLTEKKATLTLNAPAHQTYDDGLDANATLTGEIPGVTNPTIHYSKGSVTLSSAPTDAGTYTAWCQLGSATARVEYTIGKATNNGWTTQPQAKQNLKYTGQPQALITAGTASAGSALYTVGTDPDNEPDETAGGRPYTSSVPEMTNAGTYYVWCKIDGGKNYTSINAQKVEVTIAKANPTATAPSGSATYGQTLADVTLTNPEGNTPGTWAWVDSTTSVGSVGGNTFKANFTPTDTTNYNSVSDVKVTVNVGKADAVTATVTANTLTYNGQEQALVTVDKSTLVGGTMYYALGTDDQTAPSEGWDTSIPTATDAGTYYVWYKVVGDENHFDTDPVPVKVTISNPSGGGGTADAVQQVVDKINALPAPDQVTLNDEKLIKEAREAYDKLTDTQKQDSRLTQAIKNKLGDCETTLEKAKKADEDQKAADNASKQIEALPAADKVTTGDKAAIESARKAYESLTDNQKKKVSEDTLKKLAEAETALAAAQVKAVKSVTVNAKKVNAKTLKAAIAKAGGSSKYVNTIIIGKKVKKISKNAFKNCGKTKTLVIKSKKLKKSTVKNSLKGSKITKVKIKVGNKKTNKKYVKKYKTIFTKKNAGKKVKVSL